ncbi:MAG: hypothetical protein KBC20_07465 [Oscillospiraceae bacterium]|nr:hypothetical protein [Oscillospiraceae bacterium]
MENKLAVNAKSCATKAGRRFLALLLACVLTFSLSACGGQKTGGSEEIKPVTVEREPEPQALQTANEATAIALRQYVYARLLTEAFLTADASAMTAEELSEMADELLLAWENAELFSSTAMELTDQAVLLLEMPSVKQTSAVGQPPAKFMTLAATPLNFSVVAYAAESGRKIDPQTWAENLTKQYDALKGAKRYQQLAQQLGTDAKTAYEQMVLAQKIIRNAAELEEAEGVVNAYTESINYLQGLKTTSKVAMLGWSMAATGGGSVTLLEGSGLLVGGVDCIVDVAETSSTLVLGENHQVAVAFGDIKEKLGPVSSLIGLATLNPSGIGNTAKDTAEAAIYITDSLVDLFYEDKIVGVKVEGLSDQATRISGQVFEAGEKAVLEAAGFLFPATTKTLSQLIGLWKPEPEVMIARLDALVSQMAELERAAGIASEVPSEPGSAESTMPSESPENTPAEDATIFGTYSQVATKEFTGKANGEEGETEISTIIIKDAGGGLLVLIDEEYDDKTYLDYDPVTNIVHNESAGITVHIEFSLSEGGVTGSGYIRGTLWGEPIGATLSLTKISD